MPIAQTHPPLTITNEVQTDLIRRALAAFYGSGGTVPPDAARDPVAGRLATKKGTAASDHRSMHFVVIHAGAVVLAVFRVRQVNDYLMLRRMVRPPKDIVRLKRSQTGVVGNDAGNE